MKRNIIVRNLILICCTFFLFGCAEVQYIRKIDDNGAVLDSIIIELDEDKILSSGVSMENYETFLNEVISDTRVYETAVNNWKIQFSYNIDLYKIVNEGIKVRVLGLEYYTQTKKIIVETYFSSTALFYLFYGKDVTYEGELVNIESIMIRDYGGLLITDDLNNEILREDYSPFLYKTNIVKTFPYNSDIENEKFITQNNKSYFDKYNELLYFEDLFDISDVNFSQIVSVTNDRLYTNSDDVYVDGVGFINHFWDFNNNMHTNQLEFYYLMANRSVWYMLAFGISIIAVTIILIVAKIKNLKIGKVVVNDEVNMGGLLGDDDEAGV